MTKKECQYVLKVLEHIKDTDQHVAKAIAFVKKDLAIFEAAKGQLKDQYEPDYQYW